MEKNAIKQMLKIHNISLVQFSKDMDISRPTLNKYIDIFLRGMEIPNQKYSQIFDKLFREEHTTKISFINEYKRFSRLITKDKNLGIKDFDITRTSLISDLHEIMIEDLSKDDYNRDIYSFIEYVILSYRLNPLLVQISEFYSRLYITDESQIEDNEFIRFISGYNEFRLKYKSNIDDFNIEYYKSYLQEVHSNYLDRLEIEQRIKNEVEEKVKEFINENLNRLLKEKMEKGEDIRKINLDDLMSEIDLTRFKVKGGK